MISSFLLHILAMTAMLMDHSWATLFPYMEWLTCVGRIAFPIFAFMIVEGYFHTSDIKKYLLRMFIFALISEVPFDYIYGSTPFYPYHQNVLWTFLLSLLLIILIENIKKKFSIYTAVPLIALVSILGFAIGMLTMVDYYGVGVLTVLTFYFFHGKKWWCFIGQFICLFYLNVEILGGYYYNVEIFGHNFEVIQQGIALLALIPIWLYSGKQGYHKKWFQYFCYSFYPAHLLILFIVWRLVS